MHQQDSNRVAHQLRSKRATSDQQPDISRTAAGPHRGCNRAAVGQQPEGGRTAAGQLHGRRRTASGQYHDFITTAAGQLPGRNRTSWGYTANRRIASYEHNATSPALLTALRRHCVGCADTTTPILVFLELCLPANQKDPLGAWRRPSRNLTGDSKAPSHFKWGE